MNSLNTDCLIEILKFLNLQDQISLYQVNTHLELAVTTRWRIKYKRVHLNFLEVPLSSKEFSIFINSIKDIVEILQLRFLNKERYDIIKQHCFEKVNNFRFMLSKPYFMEDNDVKDLKDILPNLQAFSPHGNLSGQYMDQWPTLKNLNLSFCFKLQMLQFQNIMSQLKLEKLKLNIFPNNIQSEPMNLADAQLEHLKYLELNTYEFYYFLAKPLTALKELIITNHYNSSQLFDVILSIWQAQDIRLVETANVDNILVNCLKLHLNVEELTIVNDENALPAHIIPSLHLLTDLRKLRFRGCLIKSKDFINLLANCPQLNEISFENCPFDSAKIVIKAVEVVSQRANKLRLNMYENRLMPASDPYNPDWQKGMEQTVCIEVNVVGSHNLLQLTHFKGDPVSYEPLRVIYR